ncbi:MAG: PepSY-associated TM helix domain-containing protein [Sphingomonas oligoaromativorans]
MQPPPVRHRRKPALKWRNWWLKQLHTWHWVSAAISLTAMLAFAITGITLNHAASIPAHPVTVDREALLPASLRPLLAHPAAKDAPLPEPVASAVKAEVGLDAGGRAAEWSDDAVYVALPRPGGDGWVSIDRASWKITSEVTDQGWISYLNDLHKGRNTGRAWFWFIDVFAMACVFFTLTGLVLLYIHAKRRPSTWPLVLGGFAIPFLLAVLFIH